MNPHKLSPLILVVCLIYTFIITSCSTQSKIAMKPATVLSRDVFTCKGLSPNNHWMGVTNQFDPETDPRVVVVANFAKADLNTRIQYEITNPLDNIVIVESIDQPKNNPLGIYVEMSRLMELGGEGDWQANVFANGRPIGQANFSIGEKTDDTEDTEGIPAYYVVGEDQLAEEQQQIAPVENESADSYIQESTPDLEIPSDEELEAGLSGANENNEAIPANEIDDSTGEIDEAQAVGETLPQLRTNVQEEPPVTP